ncbi:MAG TPA: hypothetical protein VIH61_07070 [Waddliaceae bacterium]
MNDISNLLVKIDHFCDYIPLVSSVTNLVDLFQKCVVLPFMDKTTIVSNHYYKHINEKSFVRCFLLVIPVIGNIIIGICVFSKKKHDDDTIENLKEKEVDTDDDTVENLKEKEVNTDDVEVGKGTSSRPQDDSLENINNMTEDSIGKLCQSLEVNDRNDYIKCMLIFAIKAEKFHDGGVDRTFHDAIRYCQEEDGELKEFVHEDIAAGRNNQENTLLHEILKCEFLSSKAKGSAFGFILRDGHDFLRDYFGTRTLEVNSYGVEVADFQVVEWGDSLKNIFDIFSIEQQTEFFANSSRIADRLNSFTGIVGPLASRIVYS